MKPPLQSPQADREPEPLAVAPKEAARRSNLGRTTIYEALASGQLKSLKVGRRRLILLEELRDWLLAHRAVR